ncbi:MAG TPA: hypothetical protein VET23_15825, partial [Chitinophagaceae bacterium]|nr:hypothetical protein [Chitinophagaceae bacterium]
MRTIKPQWFIFYFSLALIFVLSCNKKEKQITKLTFHIHYAYGYKIYLETVPFTGEKTQIIDSATVKNGDDRIIFRIPKTEERPYIVKI